MLAFVVIVYDKDLFGIPGDIMNHLRFRPLFFLVSFLILSCVTSAMAGAVSGASLAIYNSGRALVKENRSVTLPDGLASVVLKDIPKTIDATSVRVSAQGMRVSDLQYRYNPITIKNILDNYIGKELSLILPDPADANARILKKGKLVSNHGSPIFMIDKQVYVGKYEALMFPEMPRGLQQEPTLTLTTENQGEGEREILFNYLMGGLNWRADYTLSLDAEGKKGGLAAWATITNDSGRGFSGVDVKLVAGEVKQVPSGQQLYAKANMVRESSFAPMADGVSQEQFSEFHVYSLPNVVDIAPSGTRQVRLFSAPAVAVERELLSSYHGGRGRVSGKINQNVDVILNLSNTETAGLGRPMPAGLVRVLMPTKDGNRLLAGESSIGHIGRGDTVKLSLGRAFDVKVERSQTSFKKLGKDSYEESWRIEIRNGKDKAQSVALRDMYAGDWKVISTDTQYTSPDAGSLEFDLTIPPNAGGDPIVVNYTVQIAY